MKLNEIRDNRGARQAPKRLGRGIGSGLGKTAGKGHKGQKARSGGALRSFEGGQQPITRRVPKRGFTNIFSPKWQIVNLDRVQVAVDKGRLDAAKPVDANALVRAGVIRRAGEGIRLLAKGEIKTGLTFEVAGASKAAVAAVERAGGKVIIAGPAPAAGKGA
jgi:large subunit ribosomal protein L15